MLQCKNAVLVAFVGTRHKILPGVDGLYVQQKQMWVNEPQKVLTTKFVCNI